MKFFDNIPTIRYQGPESTDPFSFRYYDAERVVAGKTMAEHLRFAVSCWHTFLGTGQDMFGSAVHSRGWSGTNDPMERARMTIRAAFEFCRKIGMQYYCFHDRDIAPEGETFSQSCKNLEEIVKLAGELQKETGVQLLWGTANLFSNPRFTHGASTNPDAHVFAYAAAQVKHAMDATYELGGDGYVFWGGREGYETLLNTDMRKEQENLATFLHMAVDYAKKIGFTGQFLIEPKPKEPTKHQYDFDAGTVLGFLRAYDLIDHFKLNLEANHATLAGHTFAHELTVAASAGKLGSIDVNRGDMLLGWDTDQFPTDLYETTQAMLVVLQHGGIGRGGLNFDAKLRRGSTDLEDLFYAHIGGMDTFARGLLVADAIIRDGKLSDCVAKRYRTYDSGIGKVIRDGKADFDMLEQYICENGEPKLTSGRQEYLENLLNNYI